MKLITSEILKHLNRSTILEYSPGEMIGVKETGLLELSVNKAYQTAFGQEIYENDVDKICAIYTALLRNHCFYNANKRTATLAMLYMLKKNEYRYTGSKELLINLGIDYVTHKIDDDKVTLIIYNNIDVIE